MNIKKCFLSTISVLLCVVLLVACGNFSTMQNERLYTSPTELVSIKSGVVAENNNIELSWDYKKSCVFVKNKQTGATWSTVPYEVYSGEKKITSNYVQNNLSSALFVKYIDSKNNIEMDLTSNEDATYILANKLKTGIRVTYYFDNENISIPVSYRIEEDGVSVSIEVSQIKEGENKIFQVALLPFFASVKNNTDSYLFVPSGSGALMKTDDKLRTVRNYSEPVYGEDASNQGIYLDTEKETVRIPVFGVKGEENSLFAIITDGAETSDINAVAGEERFGYSSVYTVFNLRGKSDHSLKGNSNQNSNVVKFSDDIVDINSATVRYVLLTDNSGYNGMAEYYRTYLVKNGMKKSAQIPDTMITLLGGARVRRHILGIPYYTISKLTDLEEAKNILNDIVNSTGASVAVNLKGFGPTGLDSVTYAGKYSVSSKLGGKKELKIFLEWASNKNISTFFDFDTVFFKESYKNMKIKNSAASPGNIRAKYHDYTIVLRQQDTSEYLYLANRYSLAKSLNSLVSAANDLGIDGIGLSTLTKTAYSDYSRREYFCKAHMSNDVISILSALKKNNIKTFGENANGYAAEKLDYVFSTPTQTSKLNVLDDEIPFYQMVFRGHTALSGATINLSVNEDKEFLNSMITGSSLGFELTNNVENEVIIGKHSAVGSSIYDGIKSRVKKYISMAQPLYDELGDSEIVNYEKNENIATSVFSNGVVVIANYSDADVGTEFGKVEAKSFIFRGKGSN